MRADTILYEPTLDQVLGITIFTDLKYALLCVEVYNSFDAALKISCL